MHRILFTLALVGCASSGTPEVQSGYGTSDLSTQVVSSPDGMVPAGTTLYVRLDEGVSVESDVGDEFTATVTQDILSEDGELLVPDGAVVIGHVTSVVPPSSNKNGVISLALNDLVIDGTSQPLVASIVDTQIVESERHKVRGRDVGIGAAGGAILGAIIGDGLGGALVGGALGAGAGTLISLGLNSDSEIPAGSTMAIQLDKSVRSYASLRGRYH